MQESNILIVEDEALVAEDLKAHIVEMGYRAHVSDKVAVDVAAFVNSYSNLITAEPEDPFFEGLFLVNPSVLQNGADGTTYGVEVATDWQVKLTLQVKYPAK